MDRPEDSLPLAPFDNEFRNVSIGSYIGMVIVGSIPKMMTIFFCVVIAAYTTEITFARTDSATAASSICYNNPKAQTSSPRICHSLMGVAISSILVCMVLIILDVFIPCVNIQFKRLAHGVSLLISLVMGIMLLVTSSKMANLYTKYCDKDYNFVYNNNDFSSPYHHNYQAECEQNENHFLILPLFGYFTLCAWGLNGLISVIMLRICKKIEVMDDKQ